MILEPGKLFLTKLMESDRKIEILFAKIDATVEGFPIEVRQLLPLSHLQLFVPVVCCLLGQCDIPSYVLL